MTRYTPPSELSSVGDLADKIRAAVAMLDPAEVKDMVERGVIPAAQLAALLEDRL